MKITHSEATASGLAQLDKLLEHRSRLGACVLLADVDALNFSRLKRLLKETDGNMGAHLRKLEDTGYLCVDKRFENRKPVSWYSLTKKGRSALTSHIKALQAVIGSARIE
ncbi:MAG: transcriptional regulator [Candidatus Latescibacteria bacterium]|nr:transcriptional regulator [Candidatus Latescibacterota bacterium]